MTEDDLRLMILALAGLLMLVGVVAWRARRRRRRRDPRTARLDWRGTWRCRHLDAQGKRAPPRRLRAADAVTPDRQQPEICAWATCPDCGTGWRVWTSDAAPVTVAKWYVDSVPGAGRSSWRYRRAPVTDIDDVIARVQAALPGVVVAQLRMSWPGDSDGFWWFELPPSRRAVTAESEDGMLPIWIEHGEDAPRPGTWAGTSAAEIADAIVDDLTSARQN